MFGYFSCFDLAVLSNVFGNPIQVHELKIGTQRREDAEKTNPKNFASLRLCEKN